MRETPPGHRRPYPTAAYGGVMLGLAVRSYTSRNPTHGRPGACPYVMRPMPAPPEGVACVMGSPSLTAEGLPGLLHTLSNVGSGINGEVGGRNGSAVRTAIERSAPYTACSGASYTNVMGLATYD